MVIWIEKKLQKYYVKDIANIIYKYYRSDLIILDLTKECPKLAADINKYMCDNGDIIKLEKIKEFAKKNTKINKVMRKINKLDEFDVIRQGSFYNTDWITKVNLKNNTPINAHLNDSTVVFMSGETDNGNAFPVCASHFFDQYNISLLFTGIYDYYALNNSCKAGKELFKLTKKIGMGDTIGYKSTETNPHCSISKFFVLSKTDLHKRILQKRYNISSKYSIGITIDEKEGKIEQCEYTHMSNLQKFKLLNEYIVTSYNYMINFIRPCSKPYNLKCYLFTGVNEMTETEMKFAILEKVPMKKFIKKEGIETININLIE